MVALTPKFPRFKDVAGWLFLVVASFLMLALLAEPASAQHIVPAPGMSGTSAWTIYGFGNAQAISDTMRAVNNFVASNTFRGIVSMLAVIGVIAVGASSGFSKMLARSFVSYSVFVLFVVYLLFGYGSGPVSVLVEVEDSVEGAWTAPVQVPAVVGIPAALVSGAGQALTRQIEASFPLPDSMKLSNGAPFNLAASLIADASRARIQDPNLAASLAYFVQDCFMIGAVRGTVPVSTLWTSTDFLTDIDPHLKSVYVNTLLGDPVGVPKLTVCSAGGSTDGLTVAPAITLIRNAVNDAGTGAGAFLTDASAWATTPALNVINAAADDVASYVMNMPTGSGGEMVKQAAVLQAFSPAFRQAASATGNSDFLTGLAVTQATETQKNSWIVGAEVFNKMMGYVFAVLQVFIYALTPLILAASLIPSLGLSLLKNFSQVLLWLAMWQPMLAIVNFVILSMQRSGLGGAFATAGASANNFAMANIGIVSERAANMGAAATFIGTMVPILAWVFVRGTIDFSRMVGSAVGENFAQQAGSTLTTGNFSLNQGSMDSFSANKTSISPISDFGNGVSVAGIEPMAVKSNQYNNQLNDGAPVTATASLGNSLSDASRTAMQAGHTSQTGTSVSVGNDVSTGTSGVHTRSGGGSSSGGSASIVAGGGRVGVDTGGGGGGRGAGNLTPGDPSSPGSVASRSPEADGFQSQPRGGVSKFRDATNLKAGADASAMRQGTRQTQSQYSDSDQLADNFARNDRGSRAVNESTGDSRSSSAAATQDQTKSNSVTVTGAAADYGQILADRRNERSAGVADAMDKLSSYYASQQPEMQAWLSGRPSEPVGFSKTWQDANGGDAFKQEFAARDAAARGEVHSPLPNGGLAAAKLAGLEKSYASSEKNTNDALKAHEGKAQRGAASQFAGIAPEDVDGAIQKANNFKQAVMSRFGLGDHPTEGGHGKSSMPGVIPVFAPQQPTVMPTPAFTALPQQEAPMAPTTATSPLPEQPQPQTAPPYNNPIGVPGGEDGRQADGAAAAQAAEAQTAQKEQTIHEMKKSGESASNSLEGINLDQLPPDIREHVVNAKDDVHQVTQAR